jgi:hypothetical protein
MAYITKASDFFTKWPSFLNYLVKLLGSLQRKSDTLGTFKKVAYSIFKAVGNKKNQL